MASVVTFSVSCPVALSLGQQTQFQLCIVCLKGFDDVGAAIAGFIYHYLLRMGRKRGIFKQEAI